METLITKTVKNEVLRYIQYNLDGDLSLSRLAKVSGFSSFHLHRILRDELGEPLGGYIKRKRMETAAFLLTLTSLPIAHIRDWVGYENDAAFSKAFSQVMNASPREFRKQTPFLASGSSLPTKYVSFDYKLVHLPPWQGLSFPGVFNYFDKSLFNCWKPAKEFLQKAGIPHHKLSFWGVLYECPNVSGNLQARIDAVVTAPDLSGSEHLFNTRYKGGRYAVFRWCAPHQMIRDITLQLSAYILHHTTLEFRESHSYVHYLENPMISHPDYLITEWYVPVK